MFSVCSTRTPLFFSNTIISPRLSSVMASRRLIMWLHTGDAIQKNTMTMASFSESMENPRMVIVPSMTNKSPRVSPNAAACIRLRAWWNRFTPNTAATIKPTPRINSPEAAANRIHSPVIGVPPLPKRAHGFQPACLSYPQWPSDPPAYVFSASTRLYTPCRTAPLPEN